MWYSKKGRTYVQFSLQSFSARSHKTLKIFNEYFHHCDKMKIHFYLLENEIESLDIYVFSREVCAILNLLFIRRSIS